MISQVSEAIQFIKSHFLNSDPNLAVSVHCSKCKKKTVCRISRIDSEACSFLENHLKHHCYVKTDFSGEEQVEIPILFGEETPLPLPIPNPRQAVETNKPEDHSLDDPKIEPAKESPGKVKLDSAEDEPRAEVDTLPMSGDAESLIEVWEDSLSGGWVKLYRKIISNPIFKDAQTLLLFVYLLLEANYKPNRFLFNKKEIRIEQGQLITGLDKISKDTGISRWQIRDRLTTLEKLGIIARKTTNKFSIVTICNYNRYQEQKIKEPHTEPQAKQEGSDKKFDGQIPHSNRTQTAPNKKLKKNTYNGRASKKPDADQRVREFEDFWGESFQKEIGNPYVFSFAKDGNLIKALLQVHSLDTLQEMTRAFFRDEQCKRRGLTIGIFFQEINRLISQRATDPIEQIKKEERLRKEREKQNESN